MSHKKAVIIKNDKTLIESVIDNSKEIINLNHVITLLIQSLAQMAICKYKPIDSDCIRATIKEYRRRVRELKVLNASMFKAFYTHQAIITNDEFHLTSAEMQAGFIFVHKKNYEGKTIRCVLFLSGVSSAFLDTIEEGEIREYTEEIEKHYLSLCKPVWTPKSRREIYLEALTQKRT